MYFITYFIKNYKNYFDKEQPEWKAQDTVDLCGTESIKISQS